MDVTLSEEQEMLKTVARDFLTEKCPTTFVREMGKDEKGYSPQMWQEIADLGWIGLIFPEKYGGGGMSFLDLYILLEEMGRACFPGPYLPTVILGGLPILDIGTEEQKQKYLPEITCGKVIFTMALLEPGGDKYVAESIKTTATAVNNDYVINGTKLFVPDAHVANYILCVARTEDSAKAEDGITIFIVDTKSPGISTTVLKTVANDKQCEVTFDNVRVPRGNILGELNKSWNDVQKIIDRAAIAKTCEMLGGMEAVLEMTLEYVKTRIQFGVPIGSFQAVQWHCVDIAINVDTSRVITNEAAWKLGKGLPCSKEAAMAKAWVSDAYEQVVISGTQAHGGVGIIEDHDMPLHFRRAKAGELAFGDARSHRKTIIHQLGFEVA